MQRLRIVFALSITLLSLISGIDLRAQQTTAANEKGLKDYFAGYFSVGVAVSPKSLTTDEAALIRKEFNSLTAENVMKMERIHPQETTYNWNDADSIAAFAKRNGMKLRGHTLVWHKQAPRWIFLDRNKDTVSKEVLLQRLKDHITTVVSRYKGTIYAWDVVNEAISDEPGEYLRNSEWLRICGEEYIAKAFQWAHEADPEALLFYNDYNETDPAKREKIYKLVKSLKDAGIPIHGIGLQGHWSINNPGEKVLIATIERFRELRLPLQVTELDISVFAGNEPRDSDANSSANAGFTKEREQRQIEMYRRCFSIFLKYKDLISSVTFWNISDRNSWLDNFPSGVVKIILYCSTKT